ncbi:MAG: alpha/beta hydrolase, partial [Actinomycetota bacterium]
MSPSLMPGAEPFAFDGGTTGVLLVHGYTGTPQGLREWGEYLAAQGHTVLCPRLPGHGTQPKDLHAVGWRDFIAEEERALGGLFER